MRRLGVPTLPVVTTQIDPGRVRPRPRMTFKDFLALESAGVRP